MIIREINGRKIQRLCDGSWRDDNILAGSWLEQCFKSGWGEVTTKSGGSGGISSWRLYDEPKAYMVTLTQNEVDKLPQWLRDKL